LKTGEAWKKLAFKERLFVKWMMERAERKEKASMNSRQRSFAVATMVFASIVLWLGTHPALGAEIPVPKDFSYEETKPLGPVPFSHKFHVTEKKLQCPECHVKPKLFEMKKLAASPQMKMANLNEGEFCGTCHNGTKAFATKDAKACARCHVKK